MQLSLRQLRRHLVEHKNFDTCNSKIEIQPKSYTADEALALIVDIKLAKHQYVCLYKGAKNRNLKMFYTSYDKVQAAKSKYYHNKNAITVTDILKSTCNLWLITHSYLIGRNSNRGFEIFQRKIQ